jgi:hypothetical protein
MNDLDSMGHGFRLKEDGVKTMERESKEAYFMNL